MESSPTTNEGTTITSITTSSSFVSPHLLSDVDILSLGIRHSDLELYRRKHYQSQFGIDTWYNIPQLQKHTFRTCILQLSFEEAESIVQKHYNKKLTSEQAQTLKQLVDRIDQTLKAEFPNGAFVKLNTRSPKDTTIYDAKNEKIQKLLEAEITKIPEKDLNDNAETIAFIRATTKALMISSGEEALKLLTASSRITEDLNKVLPFPKQLFNVKLILREWLPELPDYPQGEFRGFVHNNSLNAVSQYYSFCYFEDLVEHKEEIQRRLREFFDSIKEHFSSHSSYVIDFFVLPDRIYIIEINPFHSGAGAALFSWKDNRDLFLNGPFEFRIVETPPENPKEVIPASWQRFLNDKFHPVSRQEDDQPEREERNTWWLWTAAFIVIVAVAIRNKLK